MSFLSGRENPVCNLIHNQLPRRGEMFSLKSFIVFLVITLKTATAAVNAQSVIHEQAVRIPATLNAAAISGNGQILVVAAEQTVFVLDLAEPSGLKQIAMDQGVVGIDLSENGSSVALAMNSPEIAILDRESNQIQLRVHRRDAPDFLRQDKQSSVALFHSSAKLISTGSRLFMSDLSTGDWEMIMFIKYSRATSVIAPNDKYVALIGTPRPNELSGHVSLFGVHRGLKPLWTKWHKSVAPASFAVFSEDSTMLATTAEDGIRVWSVPDGNLITFVPRPAKDQFGGMCLLSNPDRILALMGSKLLMYAINDPGEPTLSVSLQHRAQGLVASDDCSRVVTWAGSGLVDVWSVEVTH